MAAEAGARQRALGSGEMLDRLSPARPLARRRLFVLRLLRQVVHAAVAAQAEWRFSARQPLQLVL